MQPIISAIKKCSHVWTTKNTLEHFTKNEVQRNKKCEEEERGEKLRT
jgi:hypothetical protein